MMSLSSMTRRSNLQLARKVRRRCATTSRRLDRFTEMTTTTMECLERVEQGCSERLVVATQQAELEAGRDT